MVVGNAIGVRGGSIRETRRPDDGPIDPVLHDFALHAGHIRGHFSKERACQKVSQDSDVRKKKGCRDNLNSRDVAVSQRSEEHTSELQSLAYLVCRLLLEKKKKK